jgi:hypothetical protein
MDSLPNPVVNYDSEPVLETEIEGTDYRLDPGKQGTALCISTREPGTWDWSYVGEAKWDALMLRCKDLTRPVREELSKRLRLAGSSDCD